MTLPDVRSELLALASFYGVDRDAVDSVLDSLGAQLDEYAEIVLCEEGFELITAGHGRSVFESFAQTVRCRGASDRVIAAFRLVHEALPDRIVALKLCLGGEPDAPSCYVRTMVGLSAGVSLLSGLEEVGLHCAALTERLRQSSTLYGVGFSGRETLRLKTYTLSVDEMTTGFTSHRIDVKGLHDFPKRYEREVGWSSIRRSSSKWARVLDFAARELGYREAGHVGTWTRADAASTFKVYVERIGAIPTELHRV